MTDERWKRIEGLFHSALAHAESDRAAFLAAACAGDEALLREVTSLLVQATGGVSDAPPFVLAGENVTESPAPT